MARGASRITRIASHRTTSSIYVPAGFFFAAGFFFVAVVFLTVVFFAAGFFAAGFFAAGFLAAVFFAGALATMFVIRSGVLRALRRRRASCSADRATTILQRMHYRSRVRVRVRVRRLKNEKMKNENHMYYHRTYGSYIIITLYHIYLIFTKIINSQSIDRRTDTTTTRFVFFVLFRCSFVVRSFVRRIIHSCIKENTLYTSYTYLSIIQKSEYYLYKSRG